MLTLKEYLISYKSLSITFLCFAILNMAVFFIIKKLYEKNEDNFIKNMLILSTVQKYSGIALIAVSVALSASREFFISGDENRFFLKLPLLLFILAGICWTGIFSFILKLLRKYEMKKIKINLLRNEISGQKKYIEPADCAFNIKQTDLKEIMKIIYLTFFIIVFSCLFGYYFSNL